MRRSVLGLCIGLLLVLGYSSVRAEDDRLEGLARTMLADDELAFDGILEVLEELSGSEIQDLMSRVRRMARAHAKTGDRNAFGETPASDHPMVTIEARILEVPRGTFDMQPTAQDPVRYLDDAQTELILRAAERSEQIEVLASPRLTAYSGQHANISAINQTSFVQDYDIERTKDKAIADPIIGVIQEGLTLDLRPIVSLDGKFITVEMDGTWSKLARPIAELEISVLNDHKVKVQLPEVAMHRLKASATMPSGSSALIGGGPLVNRDGTPYARMVLLHVQRVNLDDIKPK